MSGKANLSIFVPDNTVASMQDELADGSVARAVEAIKAAYTKFDSDGKVDVVDYGTGVHEAVDTAINHADATTGADLLVIVTDFEGNHGMTGDLLNRLGDDFVVFVPVSNQGYDTAFATQLDDHHPKANQIDVVEPASLGNPDIADDEVGPWHEALAA